MTCDTVQQIRGTEYGKSPATDELTHTAETALSSANAYDVRLRAKVQTAKSSTNNHHSNQEELF